MKKERTRQRISLREMGKRLGVTGQQVHFFENGYTALKLKDYLLICDILGISPRKFIGNEEFLDGHEHEALVERILNLPKRDLGMIYAMLDFFEKQG